LVIKILLIIRFQSIAGGHLMKLAHIFPAILLAMLNFHTFGQTNIPGGEVYGAWDVAGSPYLINETVTIPDDSTLVIEPGVVVEFQGYYALQVQGRLLAVGTPSDSILFTVNDTIGFSQADTSLGGWNGIRFTDTPLENDTSKIIHCCLQFSKAVGPVWHLNAGGAISMLQFGKVVVSDCLIRNNSAGSRTDHPPIGGGLYLFKSDAVISNNLFLDNRAYLGGAVFMDDSKPVFSGNVISGNSAFAGAGVGMGGTSAPTFFNDVIMNNIAENQGGGMLFHESTVVTCNGVIFDGNSAVWGGGIGMGGGELYANDCQFTANYVQLWGGGVAGNNATLHIDGCIFEQDSSSWGSGGLHMDHAVAEIRNTLFEENKAVFGGGMHALFSEVTSVNNHFTGNRTGGGGGIHLENSDCMIDQCRFEGNRAMDGTGGAVDFWADSTIFGRAYQLTIAGSMILDNSSSVNSGAVRIEQLDAGSSLVDLVVDSCRFLDNHSDVYGSLRIGGGIREFTVSNSLFAGNTSARFVAGPGFITNSTGNVINSVFASNYTQYSDSTYNAHGCSLGSQASVDFINCTFADTSDAGGVGLSVRRGGVANLMNCIFWGTGYRPVSLVTAAEMGCVVAVNYCNVENGMDSIYVSDTASTLLYGEGNIATDPRFRDVWQGDLHLTDSSSCIGAGINTLEIGGRLFEAPVDDIEGSVRPSPQNSQADMGAYEHPLGNPLSTRPGSQFRNDNDPWLSAYPNPFNDHVVLSYHLKTGSRVELSIFNSLGQHVKTLVSSYQPSGSHQVEWDAGRHAVGAYYCRITTGRQHVQTRKLILLK
jgi:hypothetical protein